MPTRRLTTSPQLAARFVTIPAGRFWMGSESGGVEESPLHQVQLGSFELGVHPVVNADFGLFLSDTGHAPPRGWGRPPFDHPRAPVVGVSWFDAVAFCDWLGASLGARCHLPTEAQRERAARGGVEGELYPWGNVSPRLEGHYARGLSGPQVGFPRPVGEEAPNGFGLHEMGAGVHEWCSDWYAADYYAGSSIVEPRGPEGGLRRASRGGSWRHDLKFSRCAARSRLAPAKRFTDYGLRVARSSAFEYVP